MSLRKHRYTSEIHTKYNKLVRDNIPDIIRNNGEECITKILSDEDYEKALEAKLDEEVKEFHKDKTLSELADIMEVVYAIAASRGYSAENLNEIRMIKRKEKGGFENKIFLKETIKKTDGYCR